MPSRFQGVSPQVSSTASMIPLAMAFTCRSDPPVPMTKKSAMLLTSRRSMTVMSAARLSAMASTARAARTGLGLSGVRRREGSGAEDWLGEAICGYDIGAESGEKKQMAGPGRLPVTLKWGERLVVVPDDDGRVEIILRF
jgi:hypothetical protein